MLDPNNQSIQITTTAHRGRIEISTKIKAFVQNTTQRGNLHDVPDGDWFTQNQEFTKRLIIEELEHLFSLEMN